MGPRWRRCVGASTCDCRQRRFGCLEIIWETCSPAIFLSHVSAKAPQTIRLESSAQTNNSTAPMGGNSRRRGNYCQVKSSYLRSNWSANLQVVGAGAASQKLCTFCAAKCARARATRAFSQSRKQRRHADTLAPCSRICGELCVAVLCPRLAKVRESLPLRVPEQLPSCDVYPCASRDGWLSISW